MTEPNGNDESYEDKAVTDDGVDTLAQGHGEPPEDAAGVTGGEDADPDPNPAFHGAGEPEAGPAAPDRSDDLPTHTAYEEGTTET